MNKYNPGLKILTGIAIILVVLGHLDFQILSFWQVLPYYSYHVMIFLFVSGYFYKPEKEEHILLYIKTKALHLLLPYFVWNVVYAIISTILAGYGFGYVNRFTVYNFFIEPFLGGHQYGLNFAAWFVPALFLIEVINICGRKIMSLVHLNYEWLIFAVTLVLGVATVYLAQTGHVWGYYKTPGRILFMLPIYEFGRFYRLYIEEKELKIHPVIEIGILMLIQMGLYFISGGSLNFSAVWCTGFASFPFMPYLTTVIGILFWLRISRILAGKVLGNVLEWIGKESFSIMMHHVLVFFVINLISLGFCKLAGNPDSFDMNEFLSNVNYAYLVNGLNAWKMLYAIGGVFIPAGISCGIKKLRKKR